MRRRAALLAAGLVLTAGALAAHAGPFQTSTATASAQQAQPIPSSPYEIVGFGIAQLRDFLETEAIREPDSIEAFLGERIAPFFDFRTMARWAAGPFYRDLDQRQRARLEDRVRTMFIEALARNLGSYAIPVPPVQVFPPVSRRWGDEMTVRARVYPPGTYPLSLDFRFYQRDGRWRVFDVAANGFSAVSYYRRHFAALVRSRGPEALYR